MKCLVRICSVWWISLSCSDLADFLSRKQFLFFFLTMFSFSLSLSISICVTTSLSRHSISLSLLPTITSLFLSLFLFQSFSLYLRFSHHVSLSLSLSRFSKHNFFPTSTSLLHLSLNLSTSTNVFLFPLLMPLCKSCWFIQLTLRWQKWFKVSGENFFNQLSLHLFFSALLNFNLIQLISCLSYIQFNERIINQN